MSHQEVNYAGLVLLQLILNLSQILLKELFECERSLGFTHNSVKRLLFITLEQLGLAGPDEVSNREARCHQSMLEKVRLHHISELLLPVDVF